MRQVLDYIRERGHNSETLNVIYVIDHAGVLIDDIRTRDFLIAATPSRVSDLMDRSLCDATGHRHSTLCG